MGPLGPQSNVARSFVSREAKNGGAVGAEIETLSKINDITWQDICNSIYILCIISLTNTFHIQCIKYLLL